MADPNRVTFSLETDEADLDNVFEKYVSSIVSELDESQKQALKGCFMSGASAVLYTFDQLTANIYQMEDELMQTQEPTEEQTAAVDEACDLLMVVMTRYMNSLCAYFKIPNDAQVCHDGMLTDVKVVPDSEAGTSDIEVVKPTAKTTFDLANWNPKDDGNVQ